jgi:hypothetical protein
MNTWRIPQDHSVPRWEDPRLSQLRARRRRLLGFLLIVLGGGWLWLRVIGQADALPLPIDWLVGGVPLLERCSSGGPAPSGMEAAYGMLAAYTIHRAR